VSVRDTQTDIQTNSAENKGPSGLQSGQKHCTLYIISYLFCSYFVQIADDIMFVSASMALHSKDLVVTESKTGSLAMFTLDFDNTEASIDPHYITQVRQLSAVSDEPA